MQVVVDSGMIGNGEFVCVIVILVSWKRREVLISDVANRTNLVFDRAGCQIFGSHLGNELIVLASRIAFRFHRGHR